MTAKGLLFISLFAIVVLPSSNAQTSAGNKPRLAGIAEPLNVMLLWKAPGLEDTLLLQYFAERKGARISNVYATDGRVDDLLFRSDLPLYVAVANRLAATALADQFQGEAYFLNLETPPSLPYDDSLANVWPLDSLEQRLRKVIIASKPDIVISCVFDESERGWRDEWDSLIVRSVRAASAWLTPSAGPIYGQVPSWKPSRIFTRKPGVKSVSLAPLTSLRTTRGAAVATPAAKEFWPIRLIDVSGVRYVSESLRYGELPATARIGTTLRGFLRSIAADKVVSGRQNELLGKMAELRNRIDILLTQNRNLTMADARLLQHWRVGIENLRPWVLGVSVVFHLSDSVLAQRQVSHLVIDTILNLPPGGSNTLLFPGVHDGWALDESSQEKQPLKRTHRLLSPAKSVLDVPCSFEGLEKDRVGTRLYFFIIHTDSSPNYSCTIRLPVRITNAPKYSIDIRHPIVRAGSSDVTDFQFTNHLFDGLRDSLEVNDESVIAAPRLVRLNSKESVFRDTLALQWKRVYDDTSYTVPFLLGKHPVANFVVRHFDVAVDSTKSFLFLTQENGESSAGGAIRRLGVRCQRIVSLPEDLRGFSAIVVDEGQLPTGAASTGFFASLSRFADAGGTVLILRQRSESLRWAPWFTDWKIEHSLAIDQSARPVWDSLGTFAAAPNRLRNNPLDGWIYHWGYNVLELPTSTSVVTLFSCTKQGARYPLIVQKSQGRGKILYCELSLGYQFLNVHPDAHRLLANLLAQ